MTSFLYCQVFSGILSRMYSINSLPILAVTGDEIVLLVENQGRVNYGSGLNDFKVKVAEIYLYKIHDLCSYYYVSFYLC